MQKFFTNTMQSKFIKYILRNTPIPRINTVSNNDYLIKDCVYLYGDKFIKCVKDGYLTDDTSVEQAEYINTKQHRYEFGDMIPQITENYISKYNFYDADTHYMLGNYLRCYRDICGIDLMPFYNCFNYKILTDMHLTSNGFVLEEDKSKKVLAIPVKFNKTYTVAISSSETVLIKPIIYGTLGMIKNTMSMPLAGIKYITDAIKRFCVTQYENVYESDKVISLVDSNFNTPFTFRIDNKNIDTNIPANILQGYESSLYMIIQVPANNNSSIVVLEGDYTNTQARKVLSADYIDNIPQQRLNELLINNLALLYLNDNNIYAFSERLIEYLTLNVVDKNEELSNNISWAQDTTKFPAEHLGVWNNKFRYFLYNAYLDLDKNYLISNKDITGNIDKDVERAILKGKIKWQKEISN